KPAEKVVENTTTSIKSEKKKLSFKEQKELDQINKDLENLQKEKAKIETELSSGNLPFDDINKLSLRVGEITALLDKKEMRWLELSEI
ncbi:MAG: ABC transporter, partial [Pseudopedobacter saltans]